MNTLRGNQLCQPDQDHCLAAYIYRNTVENIRRNPGAVRQAGSTLAPITDARWLEITEFDVKDSGRLDSRSKYCYTHDHEIPEWKAAIDQWAAKRAV